MGIGQVKPAEVSPQDIVVNDYVRVFEMPQLRGQLAKLPITPGREAVCVRLQEQDRVSVLPPHLRLFHVDYLSPKEKGMHFSPSTNGRVRTIWIELKSLTAVERFVDDAVKLDPKHNEVLFENERVRVVRVHFGLGESGPIVDKRPRVIILLTDTHATVTLPDGHSETREGTAGTVQWSKGGRQATINGSVGPLENIVVELKGAEAKGK